MGYLTPDTVPAGITCRVLFIPDSEEFLANVRGALQVLINPNSWQAYGAVTPQEAADAFAPLFDRFCFNEGVCRMVGELILWAGADEPDAENVLLCDGTHYSSDDYPDLWNIVGTTYGGTGSTDFAVPDLRGKVAMGESATHSLASTGGTETVTLTEAQMPDHGHVDVGHVHALAGEFPGLALAPGELPVDVPGSGEFTSIGNADITNAGGGDPHNNLQPYLVMNYYIVAA